MKADKFATIVPNIVGNSDLRIPQSEGYEHIQNHYLSSGEREIGIVLPVGCGKSGLIAITPFAFKKTKTGTAIRFNQILVLNSLLEKKMIVAR